MSFSYVSALVSISLSSVREMLDDDDAVSAVQYMLDAGWRPPQEVDALAAEVEKWGAAYGEEALAHSDCLAEVERLRADLQDIASGGYMQACEKARAALSDSRQSTGEAMTPQRRRVS